MLLSAAGIAVAPTGANAATSISSDYDIWTEVDGNTVIP